MRVLLNLLLVAMTMAVSGWIHAAPIIEWPSILVPDRKVAMYWLAELVVQNGIPMQIRAFDPEGSGTREMQFYREWLQTKKDFSESQVEGRSVVAAREGNFRIVAELRPPKTLGKPQLRITTAWMYSDSSDVVDAGLQKALTLRVPMETDQLSDTYSFDDDLVNRTTVYANTLSVEANELHIRELALQSGWTLMSRKTIKGGMQSQTVLRRNTQEAVVAITHNGTFCSIVVSNTLKPR